MASRSRRSHRTQPYDTNNPANWTAVRLRAELSQLGIKLTSTSIPKTALKQMYEQLIAVQSGRDQSVSQDIDIPTNQDINTNSTHTESGRSVNITDQITLQPETTVSTSAGTTTGTSNSDTISMMHSTLTMVSSMQNTIVSLQGTINSLMQKQQELEKPTNTLKDFYKDKVEQSTSIAANRNQLNGVAADEMPHIDVVTDSVKKNITSGKYVNLACLLIPDFEAQSIATESLKDLQFLKKDRKDHRLDRPLSITQFYQAFGIYKRVMCSMFPLRRTELDLYEADLGNIYTHYGDIFYQYHVQFSKRAAAFLEKGIKIDWSKRDKDLFQLLIGGARSKIFEHCLQVDHESFFCPSQIDQAFPSSAKNSMGSSKISSNQDQSKDIRGRSRTYYNGKEICNNFNSLFTKFDRDPDKRVVQFSSVIYEGGVFISPIAHDLRLTV